MTERLDDITILGEERESYWTTGHIYVVQYAGQDSRFLEMQNLYKIGVARYVKKRLADTVSQSTYLYAPVRLV